MKDLIFLVSLFASFIYFALISILGLDPEESSAGIAYKVYCIIIFFISISTYLRVFPKKKINSKQVISILVIAVYIITGLISGYAIDKSWLCLVAFCMPATCIAIYYAENGNLGNMVKWVDFLILFFAVSLLFSINKLYIDIIEGTGYYSQSLSYLAAYCFVINLFVLLFGNQFERFSFFKKKTYKFICILLLPYFLIIQFFSGGRGALGTLAVGVIGIIYMYKKMYPQKQLHFIKISALLIVLGIIMLTLLSSDVMDVLLQSTERVFSFFSTDKDLYERTSGRDVVFKAAMNMIYESPLIGYGLFSYKDPPSFFSGAGYPHNLFLEIMLQGGFCLLTIFLVVLFNAFVKLFTIVRDLNKSLILLFFVFSMTFLLYSGSYIESSFFWFSFVFVFNCRTRNINVTA